MHAFLAPGPAVLRHFVYRFDACNFVHISAAEHGFSHANLYIQVFVETPAGLQTLWPYDMDVTTCHTFRFAFVVHTLDVDHPNGATTALLPPQSGTVVLTGMASPTEGIPPEVWEAMRAGMITEAHMAPRPAAQDVP